MSICLSDFGWRFSAGPPFQGGPKKSFLPELEHALGGPDNLTWIKMPNIYDSGKTRDIWRHKLNFVGHWDKALYNLYNQECSEKTGGKWDPEQRKKGAAVDLTYRQT